MARRAQTLIPRGSVPREGTPEGKAKVRLLNASKFVNRNGEIWDMYCANFTPPQIAAHFGISRQRVNQILKEWSVENPDDIPRQVVTRARLAQIDEKIADLEAEYQAAQFLGAKLAVSKELRNWWEMRCRIRGEFAPTAYYAMDETPPTRYILELPNFSDEELT